MLWSQRTYLRLLHAVYSPAEASDTSSSSSFIVASKLEKLTDYLLSCPKKLVLVCSFLLLDVRKNISKSMSMKKKRRVEADLLIFQEICVKFREHGSAMSLIGLYYAQSMEALLVTGSSDEEQLSLLLSSFEVFSRNCKVSGVAPLAEVIVKFCVVVESYAGVSEELMEVKLTLLLRALAALSFENEGVKALVPSVVSFLFNMFIEKQHSPSFPLVQKCISKICANPSPFTFSCVMSSFFYQFDLIHWQATDAIEHILETMIRVASDKMRYLPQVSSGLITHARNLTGSYLDVDSVQKRMCRVSRSGVFVPSIGRIKCKLSLGSEVTTRHFASTCDRVERMIGFALTTLKYQHSFHSSHPFDVVFESTWDDLIDIVIFCAKHSDDGDARIQQSALCEDIHKNAVVMKDLFSSPSECNSRAPAALLKLLDVMHEILNSTISRKYHSTPTLAISYLLRALDKNNHSQHLQGCSWLSRRIRDLLLFYLNAVIHWTSSDSNKPSEFSIFYALTPWQWCQLCMCARSDERRTQHQTGSIIQRLILSEPKIGPSRNKILGSSVVEHTRDLRLNLVRNTVFNVLARTGSRMGQHGLRVIVAWELQKQLVEVFGIVEVVSAIPLVLAIESFWRAYFDDASSEVDQHHEQLKFELLHNLVMFVCTFFRFVDETFNLKRLLVSEVDLFAHLDCFGSSLLYGDDGSLKVKKGLKGDKMFTSYQLPKRLNTDKIFACLLNHIAESSGLSGEEMHLVNRQLFQVTYTPVESPHELVLAYEKKRSAPPAPVPHGGAPKDNSAVVARPLKKYLRGRSFLEKHIAASERTSSPPYS